MSETATHRCTYCGARWRINADGSWALVSGRCGQCCDNAKMGHQIVPLSDGEQLSAATVDKIERNVGHVISFLGKVGRPHILVPGDLVSRTVAALGGAAQWAQADVARSLLDLRDDLRGHIEARK